MECGRAWTVSTLLFTCCLVIGGTSITTSAQPPPGTMFSDLAHHVEEELAINSMVAQGIMRPISPTKFAPDTPETLGEFAVSTQHMFNLPQPAHPINFSDVPPSSPIYAAVQAMVPYMGRHILCIGCALTTDFLPNQPV